MSDTRTEDAPPRVEVIDASGPIDRVIAEIVDPGDAADNKWIATAAYAGPAILVTALLGRSSRFARFHLNQGLVLTITWAVLWVAALIASAILAFIPVVGWILATAIDVGLVVGWFALAAIGARTALQGRAEPLPMIGKSLRIVR